MKRPGSLYPFTFSLILAALLIFPDPGICQGAELWKHPREMTFPPLSFTPPQAKRTVMGNGLVIYLLEDRELPLIQLTATVRTGSMYDPPQKSGLAAVAAKAWRNGGTREKTPRAISEELESMAAILEFSVGRESGTISLSARSGDFSRALAILADLLQNPAFDAEQLDLAKKQEVEAIRRSNDSPDEIAYREYARVLYAGNPRGRVPTIESLRRVFAVAASTEPRGFSLTSIPDGCAPSSNHCLPNCNWSGMKRTNRSRTAGSRPSSPSMCLFCQLWRSRATAGRARSIASLPGRLAGSGR